MTILKAILTTIVFLTLQFVIFFSLNKISEWLSIDIDFYWINIIITEVVSFILAYFIIFTFIFKSNPFNFSVSEKFRQVSQKTLFLMASIAIGLSFFEKPFFDLFNSFFYPEISIPSKELIDYEPNWEILIHNSILALIIAPIFEELLFRKYIFKGLLSKYSIGTSMIVSSVLFSIIHLPKYNNLIPTFIFGLICCYIYMKTKNLWYCIFLHLFGNILWLTGMTITKPIYIWISEIRYGWIYWLLCIFGAFIVFLSLKKIKTANNVYN